MSQNRVIVYSIGIAAFERHVPVPSDADHTLILRVPRTALGDVLATLTVSGSVRLVSPPMFRPPGGALDDDRLELDHDGLLESLASRLVGAEVELERYAGESLAGTLAGQATEPAVVDGVPIESRQWWLSTPSGLIRVCASEIRRVTFVDPDLQAELDRSLGRQLEQVRPGLAEVTLTLRGEVPHATATVHYAIPAASWKITYRLFIDEEEQLSIHGHAVVDNHSDEDWKQVRISLVTGQPITFSTDLAECKIPAREHLDLVSERVAGAVQPDLVSAAPAAFAHWAGERDESPATEGIAADEGFPSRNRLATVDTADVLDRGDFCQYDAAGPIDLLARQSTVVPVFQQDLPTAEAVVYFSRKANRNRPYRAIRFTHAMGHSLQRGVCAVYDRGVFAGNCVLPDCRSDETALLAFAIEQQVDIQRVREPRERRNLAIKIAGGVFERMVQEEITQRYVISCRAGRSRELVIDHHFEFSQSRIQVSWTRLESETDPEFLAYESLSSEDAPGIRIQQGIEPEGNAILTVREWRTMTHRREMLGEESARGDTIVAWIREQLSACDESVVASPLVQEVLALGVRWEETRSAVESLEADRDRLIDRQERLRKNLASVGNGAEASRWKVALEATEEALVQLLDQRLPAAMETAEAARRDWQRSVQSLDLEATLSPAG